VSVGGKDPVERGKGKGEKGKIRFWFLNWGEKEGKRETKECNHAKDRKIIPTREKKRGKRGKKSSEFWARGDGRRTMLRPKPQGERTENDPHQEGRKGKRMAHKCKFPTAKEGGKRPPELVTTRGWGEI